MTDGNPDSGVQKPLRAVKTKSKKAPRKRIDESSPAHIYGEMRHSPEMIKELFRTGKYPYKTRVRRGVYEQHKRELQVDEEDSAAIAAELHGAAAPVAGGSAKREPS